MKDTNLQSRITGAWLGLACGDALGAPAEFKSQAEIKRQYGVLQEMVGGGSFGWAPGEWTDDTGMALCVAQGLLEKPLDPVDAIGQRFLEWRKTTKDCGATCGAAISNYARFQNWHLAAQNTAAAKSGKAAGNGSLMRTLPVALAYGDREAMLEQSARISAMTHWDTQAELCCALYGLWVRKVLNGADLKDAWTAVLKDVREVVPMCGDAPEPAFWLRLEKAPTLQYQQLQPSGYAGYCVETLEAAAWLAFNTDSYEDAMIQCVNLAGEADTMAAVAGGVLGAYYGLEAIPPRWLEKLHQRTELEQFAARLAALRSHNQIYATKGLKPFSFDWVTDRVLAGRNPLTYRDVELLAAEGITHILDLREPHEWASPKFGAEAVEAIEHSKLQRRHLIVRDMQAPTVEVLEMASLFLEETLQNAENRVYVHCRAGMERTAALLIAYYARHYGVSYDEALSQLRKRRPIFKPLPDQEHAVRQWIQTTG